MWPAVRAEKHRSDKSEEEVLSLFDKTNVALWNKRPDTTTVVTYLRHNHVQFTKTVHLAAGIQQHVTDNINVLLLGTFSSWQQLHEYADLTKPSCMTSRPFSTTVGRDLKCSLIFIHYGGGYQFMRRERCILGNLIGEKYKFIGLLLAELKLKVGVAVSAVLLLVDEGKSWHTAYRRGQLLSIQRRNFFNQTPLLALPTPPPSPVSDGVQLALSSPFNSACRCPPEGRNSVLPHPGPPQLETETWVVFKRCRRPQKHKPPWQPETPPHNGAERREKLPPPTGALLPSLPVGHTRVWAARALTVNNENNNNHKNNKTPATFEFTEIHAGHGDGLYAHWSDRLKR